MRVPVGLPPVLIEAEFGRTRWDLLRECLLRVAFADVNFDLLRGKEKLADSAADNAKTSAGTSNDSTKDFGAPTSSGLKNNAISR